MKRKALIFLTILMALSVFIVVGCAKEAPPPAPPPAPAPAPPPPDPCLNAGDPLEDVYKGGWAMDCGCYDQAIELLTCAINSGQLPDKQLAIAYNFRGLAFYKRGDCLPAVWDFSKAVGMFPLYDAAFLNRMQANKACGLKDSQEYDSWMFGKLYRRAMANGWKPSGKRLWPKQCLTCK